MCFSYLYVYHACMLAIYCYSYDIHVCVGMLVTLYHSNLDSSM